MSILRFLRTVPGRVFRIAFGCGLLAIGVRDATLLGLLLVMVGLVPIVSGLANICLIEDLMAAAHSLAHQDAGTLRHKS